MKTRLDQLVVDDFVSMMCGDLSVLREDGDNVTDDVLNATAAELAIRYREIIDPVCMRAAISKNGSVCRRRMKIMLFRLCTALIELDDEEEVRRLLQEYGWSVSNMTWEKMLAKCKTEFQRLEAEEQREFDKHVPVDEEGKEDIRDGFARETAFLMRFYKMGINTKEIATDVYAHLIAQAIDEGKKLQHMKRRK